MRVLVIAGFVLFVLSVTIPFTSLASAHPCASPNPPPVTGTLVQPPPVAGNLFINEVLLTPFSTWNCSELGTHTSINDVWVEIYNSQDVAYDLYGVNAALDSGPGTNPFYFPMGSAIAAHSFLVVFPRIGNGLFPTTTTLRLLISGSIVIDEMKLPTLDMPADISYARTPDGSTTWQWLSTPTIDASNPSLPPTIPVTPSRSHHTPAAVLTAATSSRRSSGSSSGQNTSATNDGQTGTDLTTSTPSTLVDGNQPIWNKMPMPDFTSPSPTIGTTTRTATPPATSTIQAPKTDSADITTKKIVITLVAIALACSLTWCWTLFTSPNPRKQKG